MRPNIILILIDDMGWRDLSCYGSSFYETPHIDALAREGTLFTDAYAACPVCSPTRASLMSGKYPATVGVTDWIGAHTQGKLIDAPYIDHLPLSEVSLAQALREGGYETWHVGKWHLGAEDFWPDRHGFDVNLGGCHMGHPAYGYFVPYHIPTLPDGAPGEYLTDRLTQEAVALIRGHAGKEQPFFLNLWHYTVHTPCQAKEEDIAYFTRKAQRLGLDRIDPMVEGEHFPCQHKKDQHVTRRVIQSDPVYAAMIRALDDGVGAVMEALRETGQDENTLVLFTSDNGGLATAEGSPTCNAPLSEGKGWMYEGGVREPLIAWAPGKIPAGRISPQILTSPDFYPTLLEWAGLPLRPGQHKDGVSFLPALLRQDFDRGDVFWHYPHYGNQGGTPGSAMRCGDYKLLEFFEDGHRELYNLREDPSESQNLAEALPDLTEAMAVRLAAWREKAGAKIPAYNPEYYGDY